MSDNINPGHYTQFPTEVVDTLEAWVSRAPDPVCGAHQYNACKYMSRMWDKPADGGPVEHIDKAIWHLERLKKHFKASGELRTEYKSHGDINPEIYTLSEFTLGDT